jgi:arylsulfatase
VLAILALIYSTLTCPANAQSQARKPNILLILADDLGYSDIGCYGGEVQTPNLDSLAAHGLRYTQFYNTTRCWPSRAAILTGYYAQQVRRDRLPFAKSSLPALRPSWAHLIPQYLASAGYRSYHSGKWHLDGWPMKMGFDRSYFLFDLDRYFTPKRQYDDPVSLPRPTEKDGYYATKAIADHAIAHLRDHGLHFADRPFFEYLAFTAPHFPLQALPEDIAKYHNRFYAGWDVLRRERLARMRRRGIVSCELSTRTPGVPAWDTLSEADKNMWRTRMSLHAAMVDRMDQEIGRVVAQLRAMNAFDNTLILFMSDNGASAEKLERADGNDPAAPAGSSASYLCLEPGWANLANTPLRLSKIFVHEGGISTPLIVHWPAGIKARGELRRNPGHLIDLMPTILELAGASRPFSTSSGGYIPPLPGRSLVPTFAKDNTVSREYLWWYHMGNRALRVGDFKIVAEGPSTPWELYNMQTDRSEMHDLAAKYPARVKELARIWQAHVDEFQAAANSEDPPSLKDATYSQLRRPPRVPRCRHTPSPCKLQPQ